MEKEEEIELAEQDELFEHHRLVVERGHRMLRIDKFLVNRLLNTSRNRIQNAAEGGSIFVNDIAVKSNYRVKPNDTISIVLAYPPREVELLPDNIPINILYEDEDVIVLDKQPGLVVHPAYGNYRGTLVNALVHHLHPDLDGKPLSSETVRPGLVHRIDKNTSGLMVVAKTEQALTHLARQFFERTIERLYIALVWGDFKEENGTVTAHVGRNLINRKVMDVFPDGEHGKHAVTHFNVMERLGYVSLVQCKLETGRTHQIRVHMKYAGHPVFNDDTYGGNRILKGTVFAKYKQFVENCFDLMPRHALHAHTLGFVHPTTNKIMQFVSPLPTDFFSVVEKWRKYGKG